MIKLEMPASRVEGLRR